MQKMEISLNNELLEGEELIWSGRSAERRKSMASSTRSKLQVRAQIYTVLGLILIFIAIIFEILIGDLQAGRESFILLPGFGIFIMGIYLYIIDKAARFLVEPELYAITNQRIIILYGSRYQRIISFNRRMIEQVQCIEHPDGSGDLMFSGILLSPGVYMIKARTKRREYVLRAIPNVRLVERELLGRIE